MCLVRVIFHLGVIHYFYTCACLPSFKLDIKSISSAVGLKIHNFFFVDILKISVYKETRESMLEYSTIFSILFLLDIFYCPFVSLDHLEFYLFRKGFCNTKTKLMLYAKHRNMGSK